MTSSVTAFQELCQDYTPLLIEQVSGQTIKSNEAIAATEFKVEEAWAVSDALKTKTEMAETVLLPSLRDNVQEIDAVFKKIDQFEELLEQFERVIEAYETRTDQLERAAEPVFHPKSVTRMLRNFRLTRSTSENPSDDQHLEIPEIPYVRQFFNEYHNSPATSSEETKDP